MLILALGEESKIPIGIQKTAEIKPPIKEKDGGIAEECSCDDDHGRKKEESQFSDTDAEQLIEFEDELHNTVYVRYVFSTFSFS